jgi:aryl-alcohol dehydrogenase-like predicted oxidoreductase
MELRPLGHTDVSVSQFCLGAMMFGAGGNTDHDESIRIIQRALDAGINFIDTADVYGAGESEEIVGKALAGGRRDDVVLTDDVLDRIDEIVPPGTTINPADTSFNNPALEPAARRR